MSARLLALALMALLALPAAAADAGPITRKKSMWGPAFKDGVSQFPLYADLGVGIWQTIIQWDATAPTRPVNPRDPGDPAYRWPADLDAALQNARAMGIDTAVSVLFTPGWANGDRPPSHIPNDPGDFADFVEAAVRRYPQVAYWLIWIEPTKSQNFQPLHDDLNRRLSGKRRRPAQAYARLLDGAYARVKRVNRSAKVIGGNTFTLGTVRPRWWIEAMRLPNGRRPRMDLWGHNPFTLRRPRLRQPPTDGNYSDFGDLDRLMGWLDRYYGRVRSTGKRLPIFISEFSLPTDHENFEFNFFVTRRTQASWLRDAVREVRRHPRLHTFGYLGLHDDPLRPDGQQVERGLITRDGVRKPGYAAFRDA